MKKTYLFLVLLFSCSALAQFDYQKIWSTYYFPDTTKAYGSVIDSDGNIIVVGSFYRTIYGISNPTEFHPSAYYEPYITPNAHQTTLSEDNIYNQNDGFITKFSPDGGVIWSTFLGGSKNDGVIHVAVDNQNNIYVTGLTRSATAIATAGAYISNYASMADISSGDIDSSISGYGFLSKFNASGSLQWSTYLPGVGSVYNTSIFSLPLFVSNTNAIYVAGSVALQNSNNITTLGAFQENFLSSIRNGFILKFDGQGNRLAGTYFGSGTFIKDITADSQGSLVIVGYQHYRSDEILATPGSYQPTRPSFAPSLLNGGAGFIAKLSPDLSSRIWCTYYGDTTTPITLDAVSTAGTDIYFTGRGAANNSTAIQGCATPGAFSEVPSRGFMAKLNGAGTTRIWGTYLPFIDHIFGNLDINRVSDLTINNNKLYIVGKTSATTGVSTAGAYQANYVSVLGQTSIPTTDTFIMQFSLEGARNWGTYFGGLLDDFISSINVTENNNFYISGYTSSTTMIATPNSLQPNLIVSTPTYERVTNMFLAKFANPLGVENFAANNLKIAPNPNNGRFVLSGSLRTLYDTLSLVVYDNLGRVIAAQNLPSLQTAIYNEFDFSGVLAKGVYFARLTSGDEPLQTFKILIE